MRNLFPDGPGSSGNLPKTVLGRRDYETAFDLLNQASSAFYILMKRCQQLENEVQQVKEQAWAEVESAGRSTKQWQQLAATMKAHLEHSDTELAALKRRVEEAEARLLAEREAMAAAEQHAHAAMDLTTLFHDKIVAAFGIGSQAHVALDAVANGKVAGEPIRSGS